MSLILEALRKSEAQRQLGKAPGLHSATPIVRRERSLPRWLVPALVLMAVGAMAWGLGRMAVPDPSNGAAAPASLPLDEPVVLPLPAQQQPAAEAAPAASGTPAPTPAAPATGIPAQAPASRPTTAAEPSPSPAAPASAAPLQAPPAAQEPAAPPPASTRTPAATPEAPATAVAAEESLERLSDLPAAQRAALPELRISMHVYADDPERRFAIIDGRRVGEGALLPGGVVVEAIRREGIVVDLDGRRVLLPRP